MKYIKEYRLKSREILFLTADSLGAAKSGKSKYWMCSQSFLAYIDLKTSELHKGEGRLVWYISDEEMKNPKLKNKLKNNSIYKLKVRELIDKNVPEGRLKSFYNRFLLVDIMEEDLDNKELKLILEDYLQPLRVYDETLGELLLNKKLRFFEAKMDWLENKVSLYLDLDSSGNIEAWTEARDHLLKLYENQKVKDLEFRNFIVEELLDLANDWNEDEINAEDFKNRISMSELSIDGEGNFTGYYRDDDIFLSHIISIYGNVEGPLESANIEG